MKELLLDNVLPAGVIALTICLVLVFALREVHILVGGPTLIAAAILLAGITLIALASLAACQQVTIRQSTAGVPAMRCDNCQATRLTHKFVTFENPSGRPRMVCRSCWQGHLDRIRYQINGGKPPTLREVCLFLSTRLCVLPCCHRLHSVGCFKEALKMFQQ